MKQEKERNKTSIEVDKTTQQDLMLFKIQCKVKNLDEVIKKAIKLLRKEVKNEPKFSN